MQVHIEQKYNNYCLHADKIDVWEFSLSNNVVLPHCLSVDEQARCDRFYFAKDRRRFMNARTILRCILANYLQLDAEELLFTYNKYGKPSIINTKSLTFNLSHSRDLALLAIGETSLGIDLEFFSARPYEGLARAAFSLREQQEFTLLPKCLKVLAFFNVWTQKEALIKACGLGLSYPTQEFNVPVKCQGTKLILDTKHNLWWKITSFMPRTYCCAAICFSPSIKIINYRKFVF